MENLKIGTRNHESQTEALIKLDKFKDIPFNKIINVTPFLGICYSKI